MKYLPVACVLYTLFSCPVFAQTVPSPVPAESSGQPGGQPDANSTVLEQARAAYNTKNYAKSRDLLLKQLLLPAVPAGTHLLLARTYLAMDQKVQALNMMQQGIEEAFQPSEIFALYMLKHDATRYKAAEGENMISLLLEQENAGTHFAELMKSQHSDDYVSAFFTVATRRLQEVLSKGNTLDQLQLLKTLDALQPRLDDVSQRRYRFLLEDQWELHPDIDVLRQYVVADYLKAEAYEFLLAFYRRELQMRASQWNADEKSEAYQRIADLHLKLGYLDFAFKNYEIALEQNPNNLEALKRQGLIYLSQQRFADAQKAFKTVFSRNPLDTENRYYLALNYYYQAQKPAADRLVTGIEGPAYLQELVDLARVNPAVPPRLWNLLTRSPSFLKSHGRR